MYRFLKIKNRKIVLARIVQFVAIFFISKIGKKYTKELQTHVATIFEIKQKGHMQLQFE